MSKRKVYFPKRVITLDMDGTVYDPWHCCSRADSASRNLGSPQCRHLRKEIRRSVLDLSKRMDAEIVILSYRSGYEERNTREWLAHVNIPAKRVFHLTSPDVLELQRCARDKVRMDHTLTGQAAYKTRVVKMLQQIGVTVVASYDDNDKVIDSLSRSGVPLAIRVPYIASVSDAEFRAGRKGQRLMVVPNVSTKQPDLYNPQLPWHLDDAMVVHSD